MDRAFVPGNRNLHTIDKSDIVASGYLGCLFQARDIVMIRQGQDPHATGSRMLDERSWRQGAI